MNADLCLPDVMQVCRNGHVITELLRSCPEQGLSHCSRCGALTIDRCPTCGLELPGAVPVPGMAPVGRAKPPGFCAGCGATFPWSESRSTASGANSSLPLLENVLRRLPRMIRQLRNRHGDRPPFRVTDVHDLEDLLRGVLSLDFDEIYPETRTPSYAAGSRTDLFLAQPAIAVTVKMASLPENQLVDQWIEDIAYYRQRGGCRGLIGLVYDPEMRFVDPTDLERQGNRESTEEMETRLVTAR